MTYNSLTCFASKQIILHGAKCYISLVRQDSGYELVSTEYEGVRRMEEAVSNNTAHPNCFWDPLTGFMEATFDEDDILTLCRTRRNFEQMVYLVESVLSDAAVVEEGANSVHETPYDINSFMTANTPKVLEYLKMTPGSAPDAACFAALFDEFDALFDYTLWATIRNRLFIGKNGRLRPAQFAAIHGEAFEQLAKMTAGEDLRKPLRETFAGMLKRIQHMAGGKFVSQCRALLFKLRPEDKEHLVDTASWAFLDEFSQYYGSFSPASKVREGVALRPLIEQYLTREVSDDELFEAVAPLLEEQLVLQEMDALNIQIMPLVFIGFVGDNHVGLRYASFAQRVGKAIAKKQDRNLDD